MILNQDDPTCGRNRSITRLWRSLSVCLVALTLGSCFDFSSSGVPREKISGGRLEIEDLALSPDGQVIAFQYVDRAEGQHGGIGLLNWHSGKLTKVPVPHIREVSFSPDGKRLVASTVTHLLVIDLATFTATQVTGDWPSTAIYQQRQVPVFQPGTDKILYVTGYPEQLMLVDPVDHAETAVLGAESGFYAISRPSFVGQDEIVFSGMDPREARLKAAIKGLGLHWDKSAVQYRLKFGGAPEFTMKEILDHSRSVNPKGGDIPNTATSNDGKKTVFIDLSSTDPNLKGKFNYEIFLLEAGKVTQMTNLKSHMRCVAISADGSTVAFGSDPTHGMTHDLFVLDLRNGAIRQMFLAQRLEKSPEFNNLPAR